MTCHKHSFPKGMLRQPFDVWKFKFIDRVNTVGLGLFYLNGLSFYDLLLHTVIGTAEFKNKVKKNFNPHFGADFNLFLSFWAKPNLVERG